MPEPAPAELELLQAFVNTAATDGHADSLATSAALGRWLSRRGLLDEGIEVPKRELTRFHDARAALRSLLAAKTRGELDAEAAARLEMAAGEARCDVTFDDGGPCGLGPGDSSFDGALSAILAAFLLARRSSYWPHFRLCGRKGCRQAFYDASRSRTGRWCTSRCGNRVRSATHRSRRRR